MKNLLLLLSFLIMANSIKSQELESILIAADDASKITESYINPVIKGLLYDMNAGWYTTAKTHKKFGFDITINANLAIVPSADQFFDFNQSEYQYLEPKNGETTLPTIMSEEDSETTIDVSVPIGSDLYKVGSFEMPGGIADDLPLNAVPAPMVQAGLGLPFKTDLKVRMVPTLNYDDQVEASLLGLGLQHDLTQYLGPIDKLPLSVSILGAFTNMKVTYLIEDDSNADDVSVTNGEAEFKMDAYTIQALASLDFKIITIYGGIGYNSGKATAKLKGDYELEYEIQDSSGNVVTTSTETVSDPINLDFNTNGVRASLGTRINIAFFKIFGEYTIQEYNTITAGIAFSFR
ncbi:MAG: hypothetical protein HKO81_02105 [Flavobacteriaceae bacterium]|nr:hypothetical protein [Flavobacteriaceae bacterium]